MWASNKCEKHDIRMLILNGEESCPRCFCEKENAAFEVEFKAEIQQQQAKVKFNTLANKSLIQDKTLLDATFDSYIAQSNEEQVNKQQALRFVERYQQGHQFNLWFNGKPGVGKSHLSMSILKVLNSLHVSCLYIDIDEMLRKIRSSFNDKESPFTEQYFIDLLTNVDYLVLDDLGAETGNIDTNKQATDFTSKVLRAVVNGRQDKSTIVTTNLSSKALMNMYDPKLISRMMKNLETILFTETSDKRIKNIGF